MKYFAHVLILSMAVWRAQTANAEDGLQCNGAGTQQEMNACAVEIFQTADRNLNTAYKQMIDLLPAARKSTLREEQRRWLRKRDFTCREAVADSKGSSIWPLEYNECRAIATTERTQELQKSVCLLSAPICVADTIIYSGTWEPGTRNYNRFGNLTFGRQQLDWGSCRNIKFKVIKESAEKLLLEIMAENSCLLPLVNSDRFLLFEPTSSNHIELSICGNVGEAEKPAGDRRCSWGSYDRVQP